MGITQRLHRWIWPQRGERLKAAVVYTLVTLIVSAAVLLSGVRLLFAAAPALTGPVGAFVAGQLGVPVTIGSLDARLDRLRPGLVLQDVRIGTDGDDQPLALDAMTLALAPWASLRAGAPRLHALSAEGLDVSLRETPSGEWRVAGLLPGASPVAPASFLAALEGLPVDRLLIRDSRLALVDRSGDARLGFESVALRWRRAPDGEWRFALDARHGGERINARMRLGTGDDRAARAVIDLAGLSGERIAPWVPIPALQPQAAGRLDGRLWVNLAETGGVRVTADLAGNALGLLDGGVASVDVQAQAVGHAGQWRGQIRPQQVTLTNGREMTPGPIGFGREADGPWRVALRDMPLGPLAPLLSRRLERPLTLTGRTGPATLIWRDATDWRLSAAIDAQRVALADHDWRAADARFQLDAGPRGGRAEFDGGAVQPAGPSTATVLRDTPSLTQLAGTLRWWHASAGQWRVELLEGRGRLADAPLRAAGRMDLAAGQAPRLDLTASVGSLAADEVLRFLPVGVMDPRLVVWLDRAIAGGTMQAASLRWSGPVDRWPDGDGSGGFDLRARVDDVALRFQRDWLPLTALSGALRFRNRGMTINVDGGRIGAVRLRTARARIDDLSRPRLQVDGRFEGALAGMQAVVERSPLITSTARLDPLEWQGGGDLSLGLYFPFAGRPMTLDGRLRLDGASLAIRGIDGTLEAINGEVSFDRQGVAASGLRARWADRPIVATAETDGEGDDATIRVQADTRMALAEWPGMAGLSERTEGTAAWRLRWERPGFQAADPAVPEERLLIRSNLEGIAMDWPLALGKTAGSLAPLRVEWSNPGSGEAHWRLDYHDRLRARRIGDRAAVHFGERSPRLPETPSTRVSGRLPTLAPGSFTGLMGGGSAQGVGLPEPFVLDVQLAGLAVSRWRVEPIDLTGQIDAAAVDLSASGGAEGTIRRPTDQAPWTIRLGQLQLQPRSGPVADATPPTDAPPVAPDIDLVAEQVRLEDQPLGRLRLNRINAGTDAARGSLQLVGEGIDLQAQVDRTADESSGHQLRFDLYTRDAGALLQAMQFPGAMNRGEGNVSGDLRWQGRMLQPALPTLAGDLQIDLRNGNLPAVEPGAGRALGLFSLSVLPRRLGLDFSDVVGEGLSFDQLEGAWQITNGRMRTDDLMLTGPSMNIAVRGETDLVRRRYDQTATVTPQLSSALAFLGGMAGGPAAAALLFVTRGMLESGVERLADFTYHIGGRWADPRFELITPDLEGNDDDNGQR
jgi:uncharacterized protein YhdP